MGDDELGGQVRAMLARDGKIEAIKWVRERTGWGLRRSKEFVDEVERAMRSLTPGEERTMPGQEIRALVEQGSYIQAIKRVRETTGWGLKESREYVDRLRASPSLEEAVPVRPLSRSRSLDLSTPGVSLVRALLQEGRKVEAIKLVRTLTDVGLREAKEYVDSLAAQGDQEPLDEQEHARLLQEAQHLLAERARLEGERDRLWAEQERLHAARAAGGSRGPVRYKVGRNDLCPCGSGKKYKQCCLRKDRRRR